MAKARGKGTRKGAPKPAKPKRAANTGPILTNPTFELTSDPDADPAPKPARPRKPRAPKKPSTQS